MCYKLVDEESGKIICRSVIRAATEPGSANLRVDPIEPLPPPDPDLEGLMKGADFEAPFSSDRKKVPVEAIPSSTDTMNWREMERSKQAEYQDHLKEQYHENLEDVQQRYFQSQQPTFSKRQHRYPTRSKQVAYEVETVSETEATPTAPYLPPGEGKEFVFLRDKGEKEPVYKQFEFILRDNYGEPRLDHQGKKIVVIGPSPNDINGKVFLTKPDERGNMKRARVVELINKFDDDLDKNPERCKFRVAFEKNTPSSKDSFLDDIMSYNDILDYVER